jgi:hypothetical protein
MDFDIKISDLSGLDIDDYGISELTDFSQKVGQVAIEKSKKMYIWYKSLELNKKIYWVVEYGSVALNAMSGLKDAHRYG